MLELLEIAVAIMALEIGLRWPEPAILAGDTAGLMARRLVMR